MVINDCTTNRLFTLNPKVAKVELEESSKRRQIFPHYYCISPLDSDRHDIYTAQPTTKIMYVHKIICVYLQSLVSSPLLCKNCARIVPHVSWWVVVKSNMRTAFLSTKSLGNLNRDDYIKIKQKFCFRCTLS